MTDDLSRAKFEALILSAQPKIRKRIAHALAPDEVEDAVQDVIVTCLNKSNWQDILMPRSWALGVTDFVIRKYIRSRRYGADQDVEVAASVDDFSPTLVEKIGDQAELLACREKIEGILPICGLTEREAACIRATLANQHDIQTGRQIGIEANAVRSYRSLAIKKIKAAIAAINMEIK